MPRLAPVEPVPLCLKEVGECSTPLRFGGPSRDFALPIPQSTASSLVAESFVSAFHRADPVDIRMVVVLRLSKVPMNLQSGLSQSFRRNSQHNDKARNDQRRRNRREQDNAASASRKFASYNIVLALKVTMES